MKKFRVLLAMVLVLAMTMSLLVMEAAATEANVALDGTMEAAGQLDNPVVSVDAAARAGTPHPFGIGGDNKFVTVAHRSGGLNCEITIEVTEFLPKKYQMDIMMYGRNGLISSEDDCLGNDSGSGKFKCGPDVTDVMIRIIPRNVLFFPAVPRNFAVVVTY